MCIWKSQGDCGAGKTRPEPRTSSLPSFDERVVAAAASAVQRAARQEGRYLLVAEARRSAFPI